MNKSQFWAMARDLKEHPENLPKYREIYRNVYPFSDGIFKMLMANEGKPERTIKFLNAMLALGKLSVAENAQAAKLTEAEVLALKDS